MESIGGLSLERRVQQLERRLRLFQIGLVIGIFSLSIVTFSRITSNEVLADDTQKVLHLRGLVIDDEQGRPRILIGAPAPTVRGRKRNDKTVGLIVLSESGTDRVVVGAPTPSPQSGGKVSERIGDATGIEVNDNQGNERRGLAVLDNDSRIVLGLDYPSGVGGEAITLAVLPGEGPSFQLKDTSSLVRAGLVLRKDSSAKLYAVNWRDKSSLDLSVLRLAPYSFRQIVIQPDEKAFQEAIDDAKP